MKNIITVIVFFLTTTIVNAQKLELTNPMFGQATLVLDGVSFTGTRAQLSAVVVLHLPQYDNKPYIMALQNMQTNEITYYIHHIGKCQLAAYLNYIDRDANGNFYEKKSYTHTVGTIGRADGLWRKIDGDTIKYLN